MNTTPEGTEMTESQIERIVELQVDALDHRFLSSAMTQAEYDAQMRAINANADKATASISRAAEWPKHPDGRNMTFGEMTVEQAEIQWKASR